MLPNFAYSFWFSSFNAFLLRYKMEHQQRIKIAFVELNEADAPKSDSLSWNVSIGKLQQLYRKFIRICFRFFSARFLCECFVSIKKSMKRVQCSIYQHSQKLMHIIFIQIFFFVVLWTGAESSVNGLFIYILVYKCVYAYYSNWNIEFHP